METLEKKVYDAARAREVLENETFQRAFDDIRQEYAQAWINSPARDPEGREKLYWMVKLTDKLQATLTGMLTDGKMAQIELERQEEKMAQERAQGVDTHGWH